LILVDSDVLIAHLRGAGVARDWLKEARRSGGPLATSVISVAEVAGGMRTSEHKEVSRLLRILHTFPITEPIAWTAAELMRNYRPAHQGIGLGDYLVAATAQVEGLELATLNVRHFPMIKGLRPPFRV